ncbi:hypothetical protein [Xylanibacter caecicola]|uniref:hypothetical protein n=1 Tax=Xylanibacter caecicola TaxID=2736294 RepID=UPI0025868E4C|nr:hypothetical protein [Xylanibacter caecicola]
MHRTFITWTFRGIADLTQTVAVVLIIKVVHYAVCTAVLHAVTAERLKVAVFVIAVRSVVSAGIFSNRISISRLGKAGQVVIIETVTSHW